MIFSFGMPYFIFVLFPYLISTCLGDSIISSDMENNVSDTSTFWPRGVVPFSYDSVSKFSKEEKTIIFQAMKEIMDVASCITFSNIGQERRGDYVLITSRGLGNRSGKGCWSHKGRLGGPQAMNLDVGCVFKHEVISQLIHVLGINTLNER